MFSDLKAALHRKVQGDWADRKVGLMGNNKEQKVFAVLTTDSPMTLDHSQSSSQFFRNKPPGKGKGKGQPKGGKGKGKIYSKGKGK